MSRTIPSHSRAVAKLKLVLRYAVLVALAPTGLLADQLRPGDDRIDPTFIQPYQSRFKLTELANDDSESASPRGEWTDRVSLISRNEKPLLRREVTRFTAEGTRDMWRVHLVDRATLAPIVTDQRGENGAVMHMDFSGHSVTATVIPNSEATVVQVPLTFAEQPFDLSIWASLLMSVPFDVGASYQIPVVGEGGVLVWETISVDGVEQVELPSGVKVRAHRVSTKNRPWTAWLNKQRPPYIFKTLQRFPDGSQWESVLVEHSTEAHP